VISLQSLCPDCNILFNETPVGGARDRTVAGSPVDRRCADLPVAGPPARRRRAALATKSSWNGDRWGGSSVVTRYAYGPGQNRWVSAGEVSAGYFEAMGIPILRGRAFDEHDTATSTPVAIVCERLAQLLWPDKDPIGEYIANYDPSGGRGTPSWLLVVGVAKEVKVPGREDRSTPFFYMPIEQRPWMPFTSIVVRGRGSSRDLLKTLAETIVATHPGAEITQARTLDEEIGEVLYPRRLGAAILAVSGLFGLLLSTVGLYGVVSYSAAQRMREIGIRAALGAERRDILALLVRDGLLALGIGVGCGVALAFAAVRVVSSMVVAIPALDVLTLVTVPALLSAVILAACLLPARRAARVNPIDVLRAQ
jgi:putative ABC transport system permease protein